MSKLAAGSEASEPDPRQTDPVDGHAREGSEAPTRLIDAAFGRAPKLSCVQALSARNIDLMPSKGAAETPLTELPLSS